MTHSLRVLLLVSDAFGGHGGIARFNRDLTEALSASGAVREVVVLPRRVPEAPKLPSEAIVQLPAPQNKASYSLRALRTAADGFDVVVCGHVNLLPVAAAARLLASRPGRAARLALILHGVDAWQPVAVPGLSGVDLVVSVSEFTMERFLDWSRFPRERSVVLPNTYDETLRPGPKPADLVRRYRLDGRDVVMILARLDTTDRGKGVAEMLAVLPALARARPTVSYLVCGNGDDRAWLADEARRHGVHDRVVFAGFVSEEEKAAHYRLADAFVLCGHQEGFGIVLLEAIACGIPVVASVADGSREAVLGGELGELADPADPESLRDAVLRALGRPTEDHRARLAAAFGRDVFTERVTGIVERLRAPDATAD
ncbi:glycosyltransferase family 4 protein (plasmid) [Thalassobaculum sp. OXR-137]|uniref:glycosyltransferase family 4 protein n=1 Tax=Thalassobaculum sp. OXR-137 TaxID=3100173 RepID=UPI002AC98F69|nr:glycosyltransferase family 4 protein [Thalassobaculum sp. OXR-137]WPZ37244.1 glycosyltransferase family 4 protein [Thalassobaculum sp. OXR-137]